ncbi:MAG TPA: hypothetical protein VFQ53_43780 [Kofleriaceae bacterium]|nr:hypothetical protein [Kofleriaceae bacterium]
MKRWLAAVLLVAACGKGPSEDQCKQLLDHLVDLEFKKAGASAADKQKADLAVEKKKVAENKWPEFQTACVDKTARDRVECALAATDLEGVAKCDAVQ